MLISLLYGGTCNPDTSLCRWPWGSPQAQRPPVSCHTAQKAPVLEGKGRNKAGAEQCRELPGRSSAPGELMQILSLGVVETRVNGVLA